jgi:hypothetical protein
VSRMPEDREAGALRASVNEEARKSSTAPVAWFPRLAHGSPDERANWCLIGGGSGVHWPDLDEDISVESLLAGRRSGDVRSRCGAG